MIKLHVHWHSTEVPLNVHLPRALPTCGSLEYAVLAPVYAVGSSEKPSRSPISLLILQPWGLS